MTFTKSFLFGGLIALLFCGLVGYDIYRRLQAQPPAISTTPNPISIDTQDNALPSIAPLANATPQSTPTPKASPKLVVVSTPTPTPKPQVDYYLISSSQIYQPEHKHSVTEYVENSHYPQMLFIANFGVKNAKVGDKVEKRVYENGSLQETKLQEVYSTTNFHFADTYYAKTRNIGTHTVKIVYNESRGVAESNYGNNEITFTFKILPETTPPTFTIDGPYQINGQTCMRWIDLVDNVSVYTDVWGKWKIDNGDWSSPTSQNPYGCITAPSGSTHTYTVHAEDLRGNTRQESKTFTAY